MKKRYTVRYESEGKAVISTISTTLEIMNLISGDAKNSTIETKISENMPVSMHNIVAKHNASIEGY